MATLATPDTEGWSNRERDALMEAEFDRLISIQWRFLHQDWPVVKRAKYHRTEVKSVENIRKVKDFVQRRLGVIPVFFFLVVIFGVRSYPGPYRNVEKGLLILYMLLKGLSTSEMSEFLPKSSFHDVFKDFFGRETHTLDSKLMFCLANMCSSINLRLTSRSINSEGFKQITLHIDGHDSRAAYLNADKAGMYSYKLKKSGFRTQVCCDMNNMAVFVSQPAECCDFNDGTMLSRMSVERKIHHLDCIALDGGYTQYLHGIIEGSDQIKSPNFCCPVRKTRVVNRVSEKSTFSLQFKLCCLLLNIKRMVASRNITTELHHGFWMQEEFEYPDGVDTSTTQTPTSPSYAVKVKDARSIFRLQDEFLNLSLAKTTGTDGDDQEMEMMMRRQHMMLAKLLVTVEKEKTFYSMLYGKGIL
ncbi:hypothetical protein BGZ80_010560 [Entomortierella chlamydospora]|uniref:DDE Tnp4 domain-containing protein n=1 Tax=Entomortierella chlamydospora TaxID=101097 RepID=A0A9P6MVP1_9FUNG|nr:hypothetical protein BGZ79_002027 [Entomortierella chlamydospora]KAG0014243.1 hypothetical protein BGZ80_010559 [Entomortierella chlamydospora]KAG0014244.1 hypothetical protein BGZ80_010560 [Entomortierella chlamydospora]